MKKNTIYLIGAAVLAYFLLRKKSSATVGEAQKYVIAKSGGLLMDTPYGLSILYNFKGGERLPVIKDLGADSLVEFRTPVGTILRGQISDTDVINP